MQETDIVLPENISLATVFVPAVDDKGRIVWGDKLLCLYARDILTQQPGSKIIMDVKCSQATVEYIEKYGGEPIMWKTGHSLIKEKMKEMGALLAGEMSGHMFFKDNYLGFDEALFASLRLLEILSKGPMTLEGIKEWFVEDFPERDFNEMIDTLVEKQFIFINQIGRIEKYVLLLKEVNAERIPPDSVIEYIDETNDNSSIGFCAVVCLSIS